MDMGMFISQKLRKVNHLKYKLGWFKSVYLENLCDSDVLDKLKSYVFKKSKIIFSKFISLLYIKKALTPFLYLKKIALQKSRKCKYGLKIIQKESLEFSLCPENKSGIYKDEIRTQITLKYVGVKVFF